MNYSNTRSDAFLAVPLVVLSSAVTCRLPLLLLTPVWRLKTGGWYEESADARSSSLLKGNVPATTGVTRAFEAKTTFQISSCGSCRSGGTQYQGLAGGDSCGACMLQSQVHRLSSEFGFGSPGSGFILAVRGEFVALVADRQERSRELRDDNILLKDSQRCTVW
ncbi:hypothetical protein BJX65DRAFT_237115 [Aspergillus insuetus]